MITTGRRNGVSTLLICYLFAVLISACHSPQRPTLTISVAASLQESIVEVEAAYQKEHGAVDFRNNFGASGTLAREVEQGAPIDAFIAAGTKPMDELQNESLLQPDTRVNLLRNSLVLIAPSGSSLESFDQLKEKQVKLIALGDPASVPAGLYGKQTLQALHIYDGVSAKLVFGKDVRQVLTYVSTGNADAGLVYATDAQTSKQVRMVAVAPESSHDPILYPVAEVKTSKNDAAVRAFLAYLTSPAARAIFAKHGFTMA